MLLLWMKGTTRRISKEPKRPMTPPNLFGMERRMA